MKGGIIMKVSIVASFNNPIDSITLYEDMRVYKLNVTDLIVKVVCYGEIEDSLIGNVSTLLLKHSVSNITIINPSN